MTDEVLNEVIRTEVERQSADARPARTSATEAGLLSNILESSTEYSIIGKDLDGTIVLWNEGARRLYGYEREDVEGKLNCTILHTPEDIAAGMPDKVMSSALKEGKWEGSFSRVRKNGDRFTARVVITPRRDDDGAPIGFLLISKDISEETRLTEELREKNAELKEANLAKDRFLASMSHELRTPLNAIMGFTGTLLMRLPGPLNAEQEKQLRTIKTSGRHLQLLINDLLDLAKIDSGKVSVTIESVPCAEMVTEVAESLRSLAAAKGLSLVVKNSAPGAVVRADRRAFSQILINLISNAIKFTDTGGVQVAIKIHATGLLNEFAVSVIDAGIGIAESDQARVFEAFAHFAKPSGDYSDGTGLGLHLSKKLAGIMNGDITFVSHQSAGSAFTLTLPAA